MKKSKLNFILYIICISALLGSFAQNIYTPILPMIQASFHTSLYLVNVTVSLFTFVLAIMQLVYGPFIDTKGRKSVLIPSLIISTIGSIGCAFSANIYLFLFFRVVQAIGIAAIPVVAATIIGDLFEGKERGEAMSLYQMLLALAPAIGPLIGGYLGSIHGHLSVFLFLSILGILLFIINISLLPETKPTVIKQPQAKKNYWFILKNKTGCSITLIGFIQFCIYFCFLVFLPSILTNSFHLTASEIGLVFVPMSLSIMLGSYCYKVLQKHLTTKQALFITSFFNIICVTLFSFTYSINIPFLIIVTSLYGFSMGLSMPTHTTLLTEEFVQERATAIGMYNFIRYLGMSTGPLVGGFLLFNQNYFWIFFLGAIMFLLIILYAMKILCFPVTQKVK
ncbi:MULTISPECIES: MFS transporter [Bacillus]|uniref:MFS transporter n=1 Tax=Bacillus paramobilis TaxID=2817477 RepID=A0ABZ2VLU2_9BACI|nr:MFS transporter [Bacillus wiedmannii]EOP05497.1 multidrug resistance protein [Bacillus cereus BAG2O-3]EOQ15039.1 multidrug resistance protein [Bacillus cereus B5-2]MBJ8118732.1 MFS transporter [Bacillus cereus]PFW77782.1 MFS transporter [Bacillus sp. AFS075960]RFB28127.1 MFS transporter [Bacillus sp. LB(2018)]RFB48135.1 MFS transporter [Bacillus sp. dmp10]RFB71361.1 MFS transporter [Bacillus sp. AW]HDR8169549.1 MFS transporter [Bacillus thuringiensis]